jgi:hypothetical protein
MWLYCRPAISRDLYRLILEIEMGVEGICIFYKLKF